MTFPSQQPQRGFSAVFISLIIASITVVFALTASTVALGTVRTSRLVGERLSFDQTYASCRDEALMRLREQPTSQITGSTSIGGGTCTYNIGGAVPSISVHYTYTYQARERSGTVMVTQLYPRMEIQ